MQSRLTEVNNVLGMRCQEQEIEQNIFCKLHPILCGTTTSDQDRNINLSLSLASVVLPGSRTSEDGSPSFSECVYTLELKELSFFLNFIILHALFNAPMCVDSENLCMG